MGTDQNDATVDKTGGGGDEDYGGFKSLEELKTGYKGLSDESTAVKTKVQQLEKDLADARKAAEKKPETAPEVVKTVARDALSAFLEETDTTEMTDPELKKYTAKHTKLLLAAEKEEETANKADTDAVRRRHRTEFVDELISEDINVLISRHKDLTEDQLREIRAYSEANRCLPTAAYYKMEHEKTSKALAEKTKSYDDLEKKTSRHKKEHTVEDKEKDMQRPSLLRPGGRKALQDQRRKILDDKGFTTAWDKETQKPRNRLI